MPQWDEGKGTYFVSARCIAYSVSCRVKLVKIVFDDSAKYLCCKHTGPTLNCQEQHKCVNSSPP